MQVHGGTGGEADGGNIAAIPGDEFVGGNPGTANPSGGIDGGTNPGVGVSPGGNPLLDDSIFGIPADLVILVSFLIAVVALLLSLRAWFGRTGSDGLPQPNWMAIIGTSLGVLLLAVGATAYAMRLEARVFQLERDVENLRPVPRVGALSSGSSPAL